MPDRNERRHTSKGKAAGARSESQTDRDRILYTSAFRRLGGVTQVVGAVEGHVFHNRLTHTLEVAQISRRLAERLCREYGPELRKAGVVLDPEVAEAAALAHDLGHPPFGHAAEDELNRLLQAPKIRAAEAAKVFTTGTAGTAATVVKAAKGKSAPRKKGGGAKSDGLAPGKQPDAEPVTAFEGFEGNAQSFRVLTRLAAHRSRYVGLNLTRATLDAVLKYPCLYDQAPPERSHKYGAYVSDFLDFDFARLGAVTLQKSLEAQIMDHADGVAYSVHDLDDFYRVGLIPLETIGRDFYTHFESCKLANPSRASDFSACENDLKSWAENAFPRGRYSGAYIERTGLRYLNSVLIDEFVRAPSLVESDRGLKLSVSVLVLLKMRFLQHLVWKFVIETPRLATQQYGQRRIIRTLFGEFNDIVRLDEEHSKALIPGVFSRQLRELHKMSGSTFFEDAAPRLAADVVASFTDHQAGVVFRRLTGVNPGSVTDLVDY